MPPVSTVPPPPSLMAPIARRKHLNLFSASGHSSSDRSHHSSLDRSRKNGRRGKGTSMCRETRASKRFHSYRRETGAWEASSSNSHCLSLVSDRATPAPDLPGVPRTLEGPVSSPHSKACYTSSDSSCYSSVLECSCSSCHSPSCSSSIHCGVIAGHDSSGSS